MNSAWDWSAANTIPYVKLWTTAVDATMGTVMTQTLAQQDAGGYFDASKWGLTSAGVSACAAPSHVMPCDYNWDYQSINYSFNDPTSTFNVSTNNTRLAWGTEFGFLGQSSYYVNGSSFWGGPYGPPAKTATGYPASKKKSYSTYIVFGTHTGGPVEAQLTQVETVQSLALTINNGIGSVVTSGPAGAADNASMTYAPPGYNHVYGALAISANTNQLDANIAVGSGTLKKPLIIISNFTAGSPTVKLAGLALTSDVDYFASLRPSANELWITLNRDLGGATNHLEIISSGPPPAPVGLTTIAVAPTQINVSWNPVAGANSYQVDRQSSLGGAFVQIGTLMNNSFSDIGLQANTAYIYRVRAVNGSGASPNSSIHLSTTIVYTDNPIVAGVVVKAPHLAEIRSAVNVVRAFASAGAFAFTNSGAAGTVIQAVDVTELRSALDAVLPTVGFATSPYTDTPLAGVAIKAVHFEELRDRMQ
jgi:hypothetical protein